jgi:hypothetical protein
MFVAIALLPTLWATSRYHSHLAIPVMLPACLGNTDSLSIAMFLLIASNRATSLVMSMQFD